MLIRGPTTNKSDVSPTTQKSDIRKIPIVPNLVLSLENIALGYYVTGSQKKQRKGQKTNIHLRILLFFV